MKGILLGKIDEHLIDQVIPPDRIEIIRQYTELSGNVIGLHNIEQYKDEAQSAEVIWTTWGRLIWNASARRHNAWVCSLTTC